MEVLQKLVSSTCCNGRTPVSNLETRKELSDSLLLLSEFQLKENISDVHGRKVLVMVSLSLQYFKCIICVGTFTQWFDGSTLTCASSCGTCLVFQSMTYTAEELVFKFFFQKGVLCIWCANFYLKNKILPIILIPRLYAR